MRPSVERARSIGCSGSSAASTAEMLMGGYAIGQELSAPLVVDLELGCETTCAAARWRRSRIYVQTLPELSPASSDGRICLWNNAARQRRARIAMMLSSNGDSQLIRL